MNVLFCCITDGAAGTGARGNPHFGCTLCAGASDLMPRTSDLTQQRPLSGKDAPRGTPAAQQKSRALSRYDLWMREGLKAPGPRCFYLQSCQGEGKERGHEDRQEVAQKENKK